MGAPFNRLAGLFTGGFQELLVRVEPVLLYDAHTSPRVVKSSSVRRRPRMPEVAPQQ
jgi:hypothetical protein